MTTRLFASILLATTAACATAGQSTKSPSVPSEHSAPAAALDPAWEPLSFLIGEWQGSDSGAQGGSRGWFSLQPDLSGKVLVRRNVNESPQGRHEDLMVIYREGDGFRDFQTYLQGKVVRR
jgi:hypothetical protein